MAVMVLPAVVAPTRDVATPKVIDVEPAGIVTFAGTRTCGELDVSVTTAPPVGAAAPRVTVASTPAPPATVALESVMLVRTADAGKTLSVAFTAFAELAVITAATCDAG